MRQGKRAALILCLLGVLPVVWLGLALAPAASGGLPAIITRFTEVMNRPAHIELCEDSLKTVLILLLLPAQLPQGRGTRFGQVGRCPGRE